MIILTNTTDRVEIVLSGAITTNQLPCVTSYRDITTTGYTPGRELSNTNNTSDVTIVSSPASSTQRVVDYISVRNSDTVSATVTIKFDANGIEYIIFTTTLLTGERIEYNDKDGFRTYTTAGILKTFNFNTTPTAGALTTVILASDVTNNNAVANSIAPVTGLTFSCTPGRYWFRAVIEYTSAATTTGSRWSTSGTVSQDNIYIYTWNSLTVTSISNNQGLSATGVPGSASATSAATGANIAVIEGFFNANTTGSWQITFASEVANSAIVAKAGSVLFYQKLT